MDNAAGAPGPLPLTPYKMASFYQTRMDLLQVTPEKNRLRVFNPEAEHPAPKWVETEIFREDQHGNIEIGYWDLDGQLIVYFNDNKTPQPRFYHTTRLANPTGEGKYRMPKGQGTFPWFHPSLLEAFRNKTPIPTLFLTEGVFKAWEACERGIPTVGLSSITHYADHSGHLYRDIVRLIDENQVENLVICWDGDCLDISEKSLAVREELTKRPAGFYNAANKIRKLTQEQPYPTRTKAPNIWFYHVLRGCFPSDPKGLDDLLIAARETAKVGDVVADALDPERKSRHFFKMDISNSPARLHEYFGLKDPGIFYIRHAKQIGEKEFYYNGDLLIWNSDKSELQRIAPGWANDVRWIGDEFFVDRVVPGAKGDRRVLLKRTKETMKDIYGKEFLRYLKPFEGFCNVPDHWNFQQVIERDGKQFYNRYFPFKHSPEKGEYNKIVDFLQHIFGTHEVTHEVTGKKYPAYELGLDYIQLLLHQPTQALPVIVLYSPENNTGKSVFGKLLTAIFGDNCVQIGNADLQSDFNETYADKLLAICEETLLERKRDAERIKALSTSDTILVNPKGQRQFAIDFFCKFMFFSNNIRMIYVNKHDQRFWIRQVYPAVDAQGKKKDNPNLLAEMREQIPGFLHWLKVRPLATEKESRMWFHPSLIRTSTLEQVVEVNEPTEATDLREAIAEMFLQLPDDVHEIRMPLANIREEFFTQKTSSKWIQEILANYLQVDLAREGGVAVFERGSYTKFVADPDLGYREAKIHWRGRPYVFPRDRFAREVVNMMKKDAEDFLEAVTTEELPF